MNFESILKQLRIPVAPEGHHHSRIGWVQFDCPWCGKGSHRWHMGYSIAGRYVNCWRCGHRSLAETLIELTGLSYKEVRKLIGELSPHKIKELKPTGTLQIPKGVGALHAAHRHYLQRRGFNVRRTIRLWDIYGIAVAPKLQWRIFIPIHYQGKVVSWTTRSISNHVTRYISAPPEEETLPHHQLLYGEDYARHSIIIVEGPLDVWAVGPGAVSTFGTNYNPAQIKRMAKYPVRAVCFDSEKVAQQRAKRLCDDLAVFDGETYNVALKASDAGAAGGKEIKELRRRFLEPSQARAVPLVSEGHPGE